MHDRVITFITVIVVILFIWSVAHNIKNNNNGRINQINSITSKNNTIINKQRTGNLRVVCAKKETKNEKYLLGFYDGGEMYVSYGLYSQAEVGDTIVQKNVYSGYLIKSVK